MPEYQLYSLVEVLNKKLGNEESNYTIKHTKDYVKIEIA